MNILIIGENWKDYIAKCHDAWQEGLRRTFCVKQYGKGFDNYSFFSNNYRDIVKKTFRDEHIDLVILEANMHNFTFPIRGVKDINTNKAILLCDYWSEAYSHEDKFFRFIQEYNIDYILSYFKQPVDKYQDKVKQGILKGIFWMPPTFNPEIFNDWKMEKKYDVGFLAAGTTKPNLNFYPERYNIHNQLLNADLKYLYAKHPGWENFKKEHDLIGKNFSAKINSCKIFVTTGGIYNNFQPKYMEILASKSCLFATEPYDVESTGLIDGVNYVKITPDNVIGKIFELLDNPNEIERIANNGYNLAVEKYSCIALAKRFSNYRI